MNRLLFIILLVPFTSFADPNDYIKETPPAKKTTVGLENFAVEAGIRSQNGKLDVTNVSSSGANGFQVGGSGQLSFNEAWALRTGMFFTQRPFKTDASVDFTFTYFDIPAHLMYKFSDFGGVFAGPAIGLLLEGKSSSSAYKIERENSMIIPFQLGTTFKFTPVLGATIFYESVFGDAAKDITSFRAVGANLLFTFD